MSEKGNHVQFNCTDSIFEPMQEALLERIRHRRENVEANIRESHAKLQEHQRYIDDLGVSLYILEKRSNSTAVQLRNIVDDSQRTRIEIERSGDQLSRLQEQLNNAVMTVSQKVREKEMTQMEIRAMNEELIRLQHQRASTDDAIQDCRLTLSKSNTLTSDFRYSKQAQSLRLLRLESVSAGLVSDTEAINASIAGYKREIEVYDCTLRETQEATDLLKSDIRNCQSSIRSSTRALEKRLNISNESYKLVGTMEEELQVLNLEVSRLSTDIENVGTEIIELISNDLVIAENKRQRYHQQLVGHETSSDTLLQAITEKDLRIRDIIQQNARIEQEIQKIEIKTQDFIREKQVIVGFINKLTGDAALLVNQKSSLSVELGSKIKAYNSHRVYLVERRQEVIDLESKEARLMIELKTVESDRETLRKILGHANTEVVQLQLKIQEIRKDLERRKERSEIRKIKLDKIRSHVSERARVIQEALESHDKSSASLSLEGRITYLENEIKLITDMSYQLEKHKGGNMEQIRLSREESYRLRTDLDTQKVKKFVLESMQKRKNFAIKKSHDDEKCTRKEVAIAEKAYCRVGTIRLQIQLRESTINDKLRSVQDTYKQDSRIDEVESLVASNDEIISEIAQLRTTICDRSAENGRVSAILDLNKSNEPTTDRSSRINSSKFELANLTRKLKNALRCLESEKKSRQRAAVAMIKEWDVGVSGKPLVGSLSGGLRRGHNMASTCSTVASSTLSLSNNFERDDDDMGIKIETAQLAVRRLRMQLKFAQTRITQDQSKKCITSQRIREMFSGFGVEIHQPLIEEILLWHKFNSSIHS